MNYRNQSVVKGITVDRVQRNSVSGVPYLAIKKQAIAQIRPTEIGLRAKSPSQRLVDQANEKDKKGYRQGA